MKKSSVIIFLGPPGSGKGTQAKLLKEKFNLGYIGSGNLLRSRMKKEDFTGKKITKVVNKGERIPTPIIFMLWMREFEQLKRKNNFKGFVFDGSPRTVFEAKMMELAFDWYEWNHNKKVVFVNLSKKEVVKRLKKRRICSDCGTIAPVNGDPDEKNCGNCGGKLIVRPDDTLEGINRRWEWYNREVKPTVEYYRRKGDLTVVNGDQAVEDVFKDILREIT